MEFYVKSIVRKPGLIIIIISVLSIIFSIIPFVIKPIPSFSDPILGFETRGTQLAQRIITWQALIEETRPSKLLAVNPQDALDEIRYKTTYHKTNHRKKHRHRNRKNKIALTLNNYTNHQKSGKHIQGNIRTIHRNSSIIFHDHYAFGINASFTNESLKKSNNMRKKWQNLKNLDLPMLRAKYAKESKSYVCGAPVADYAHLVIAARDNSSLFTYENILNICQLGFRAVDLGGSTYEELCERPFANEDHCCPLWSLPNYIALLANKTSCLDVSEEDVTKSLLLLKECAPYFHSMLLGDDCEQQPCNVPAVCTAHNAVYNIFFYLADSKFLPPEDNNQTFLENIMIFLPLPCSSTSLPYYNIIRNENFNFGSLEIPAMDLGVKNAVFDKWLIHDTWLLLLAVLFVLVLLWFYSGSFLFMMLLLGANAYSLGIGYFLYTIVYNINFFPFMNLLVVVVVIGIGADGAFLYIKYWNVKKTEIFACRNKDKINIFCDEKQTMLLVRDTTKHCILTMFVTSLTTAVAFIASYVSHVSAINCFSVFAGTIVVVHFIIMAMWIPASVILVESINLNSTFQKLHILTKSIENSITEFGLLCNRFIYVSVLKLRWLWMIFFGFGGVIAIIVIFYYPGLQLPESKHFQLFNKMQVFEQYDMIYKEKFLFEKSIKEFGYGRKMPLRWVWGVRAIDNGNYLDPFSRSSLTYDDEFNISDPNSQEWLLNFCIRLKAQSFYQSTLGPLLPNCFIENFKSIMSRECYDSLDNIDRTPCCESSIFPFSSDVFNLCIIKIISSLYRLPREYFMPGVAGPKFFKGSNPLQVKVIVVEFESVQSFSMSYIDIHNFYSQVEEWTQKELSTAPPGLKGGWFISDLEFYDLQDTLVSGTISAVILSAALSLLVLLPSTRDILVTICAVLSMLFTVAVAVAFLVMLDWKLNALESIAICTSVGFAVDYNLHYALSFTSSLGTRLARAGASLSASASPTAAAAITTGTAGLVLLPSLVLPYHQIGVFLVLIVVVSWVYATWFLCPLLSLGGMREKRQTAREERRSASGASTICSGLPATEIHELYNFAETPLVVNQTSRRLSSLSIRSSDPAESVEPLNRKRKQSF